MKKFINIKRGPNFVGSARLSDVASFCPRTSSGGLNIFKKNVTHRFHDFFPLFFIALSDSIVLFPTLFSKKIVKLIKEKSAIKKTKEKIVKTIRDTSKDMNKYHFW